MKANLTLSAIDGFIEGNQSSSNRKHLGGSLIGRPCDRQLWYIFRWAKNVRHNAQLLRLFQRGHDEESRFVKYLTDIGVTVWDTDADGRQFRILDCDGHFGGSLDGIAFGVPDVPPDLYCLLEFKTHSSKSFKKLIDVGLLGSKWEHYVQMQVYMLKRDLPYGLYMAVNKDNDALHLEVVMLDPAIGSKYIDRASRIISTGCAPDRLTDDPTNWQCKFCDFRKICHFGDAPETNCRTCVHASAGKDAEWVCAKGKAIIKGDHVRRYDSDVIASNGCEDYELNPNF